MAQQGDSTVGDSLSVRCQYEENYRLTDKYWCRVSSYYVKRLSRPEPQKKLGMAECPSGTIQPTSLHSDLENLPEDAGTYKCASLVSSIYFKLLVFLEVPLLLIMLSAVLWVNRPQSAWKKQHCPDYENQSQEHKNKKYWCRVSLLPTCKEIVRTRASKEAGNGRVSIRDHPATLIFTVTLENLTLEDAGTCICGVDILLFDDSLREIHPSLGMDDFFKVVVSVVPGSSPENRAHTLGSPTSSPVHTQPSVTTEDTTPGPSLQPRSLQSSIFFQLLVFLEVPLLLSMLSAVLWVNRPQRCSAKKQHCPDYENQ
ncbi:CMRF35-like molecule 6 [Peromyscus leucopus]|uniref:CMRF35-like molecule 6 n=1 Tax=Peromyscus leucopus TaxID=10041 RepID=UPI001884D99F|nr:CMRF35-like molecule 6 [Peromyscus leucopus]